MARRQYAGGAAAATITGAIASSGGGTVTIDNTAGWPDGSIGKFHVVIDAGTSAEEKILMDLRSGSSLQFSSGGRGADGTVSTSHSTGAPIWICYTALDADEANAHLNTQNPAHTAAFIYFTPAGTISATNVQAAVQALDSTDSNLDTRIDTAEATLNVIQQDNWVTQQRLADNSVGTAEIVDASVTLAKLAPSSVNASKIVDDTITVAKMAPNDTSRWSTGTPLSVPTSTSPNLTWTTELEDDLSMAAPSFSTITMPSGSDGLWLVAVQVAISASFGTDGFVDLMVGTVPYGQSGRLQSAATFGFTWVVPLAATNTVTIRVGNLSGSTANVSAAGLTMSRIGKVS